MNSQRIARAPTPSRVVAAEVPQGQQLLDDLDQTVTLADVDDVVTALVEAGLLRHLSVLPPVAAEDPRLSPREVDVLALVAEGCLNREIAERLELSLNSVRTYVRTAYRKIGVVHRAQAIRWCLDQGAAGS